jgi:gliding motility-associated-like protein
MRLLWIICSITVCFVWTLGSQTTSGLVAYYPFEDCDATDASKNNSDGILYGSPGCDCGVQGNAIELDGQDDYIVLTGNVENYFGENNFTLSIYFRCTDIFGTHDIISKRDQCNQDRTFAIRYTPSSGTLSVELSESQNKKTHFIHKLQSNLCWIHLVIVRDGIEVRIYLNGLPLASMTTIGTMDFSNDASLHLGNSPCLGTTDRRFNGLIDEIRVYNRALNPNEVRSLYLYPDRIATVDTTIYVGGSAQVSVYPTCATNVRWNPAAFVSDPFALEPILTPEMTMYFTLDYLYDGCTAVDSLHITVIDPTEVTCGDVPMPSAFTPNSDGRNDTYYISSPFSVERLISFEIFDRWGNKVFFTSNINDHWDGTLHGKELNPGLFLWKLKYLCRGEEIVDSGSVMLIR